MGQITYSPPSNPRYPEEIRLSLMDGRTVLVKSGTHTYDPGVVERLVATVNVNASLSNMIHGNILRLHPDMPPSGIQMATMGNQPMGQLEQHQHVPLTPPPAYGNQGYPNAAVAAPPVQAVDGPLLGYTTQATANNPLTGAMNAQQAHQLSGQYHGVPPAVDLSVASAGSAGEVFEPRDMLGASGQPSLVPLPNGLTSEIRRNGQVEGMPAVVQDTPPEPPPITPTAQVTPPPVVTPPATTRRTKPAAAEKPVTETRKRKGRPNA